MHFVNRRYNLFFLVQHILNMIDDILNNSQNFKLNLNIVILTNHKNKMIYKCKLMKLKSFFLYRCKIGMKYFFLYSYSKDLSKFHTYYLNYSQNIHSCNYKLNHLKLDFFQESMSYNQLDEEYKICKVCYIYYKVPIQLLNNLLSIDIIIKINFQFMCILYKSFHFQCIQRKYNYIQSIQLNQSQNTPFDNYIYFQNLFLFKRK